MTDYRDQTLVTSPAMDVLPSGGIFRELQVVHDTGYFSGHPSFEEDWHQVGDFALICWTGINML